MTKLYIYIFDISVLPDNVWQYTDLRNFGYQKLELGQLELGQMELGQMELGQMDLGQLDLGQLDLGQGKLGYPVHCRR